MKAPTRRRTGLRALGAAVAFAAMAFPAGAAPKKNAAPDDVTITVTGAAEVVYNSAKDGCQPIDVPDMDPHAYRDADGDVVVFTLHFINRPLRGPDLDHLKIDCHVALDSPLDPDPSHYADRRYLATVWTDDGRTVSALVHHEYHADQHKTCRVQSSLGCWYNSILAFKSTDGGRTFEKDRPLVVAAAPFKQTFEQGRHRGFFAPSNIVSDGPYKYFFGSTTGWTGQPYGACLFRTTDPAKPATWRAYDGQSFSIAYADPYEDEAPLPKPCLSVAPFVFPVGAVVRQRNSGLWIAIFQASKTDADFPVDGFYYTSARDLLHWSAPKLLIAGQTIMSDLCKGGRAIIAYPSILDDKATTRTFQDVGNKAYLYYTRARVEGCDTAERLILRQRIDIDAGS